MSLFLFAISYVIRIFDGMRKEVNLSDYTLKKLQKLADRDKRKLKPYMEKVLEDHANMKANWPDYKTIDQAIKKLRETPLQFVKKL